MRTADEILMEKFGWVKAQGRTQLPFSVVKELIEIGQREALEAAANNAKIESWRDKGDILFRHRVDKESILNLIKPSKTK